jgi:DNA-binding beta-propeller fold protein YncE
MPGGARRQLSLSICTLACACLLASIRVPAQTAGTPSAGTNARSATMYLGTYKGTISVLDEATEKPIGEIPLKYGMTTMLQLSFDRTRFYVRDYTYEKIEIIDRVKRTSIDSFTLSEGNVRTRIWGLQPDPKDKYVILVIKKATLQPDRWEIGPPTLVQYDLATKKVARTIPWPKGEEREGAGVIFSPDGKLMYLMGEDILIYETEKFTEVDRWELSRPLEPGGGRIQFGGLDPFSDEPGFYTGLFSMQDSLQNRRVMGIGRIDLAKKSVDFFPIGPFRPVSFSMTPDRKRAYGLSQNIGEYEFWAFDLESRRVISRTPFRGRPRMSLKVSSSGTNIYISQAGNTIDIYDAATLTLQRTITLDGDMSTQLLLLPQRPPAGGR